MAPPLQGDIRFKDNELHGNHQPAKYASQLLVIPCLDSVFILYMPQFPESFIYDNAAETA
jgi:hypothetical protein